MKKSKTPQIIIDDTRDYILGEFPSLKHILILR